MMSEVIYLYTYLVECKTNIGVNTNDLYNKLAEIKEFS